MKILILVIAVLLVTFLFMTIPKQEAEVIHSPWSNYMLSEDQKDKSIISAEEGDTDAVFRLFMFYSGVEVNREKAQYYLKKGADLGRQDMVKILEKNIAERKLEVTEKSQ